METSNSIVSINMIISLVGLPISTNHLKFIAILRGFSIQLQSSISMFFPSLVLADQWQYYWVDFPSILAVFESPPVASSKHWKSTQNPIFATPLKETIIDYTLKNIPIYYPFFQIVRFCFAPLSVSLKDTLHLKSTDNRK